MRTRHNNVEGGRKCRNECDVGGLLRDVGLSWETECA